MGVNSFITWAVIHPVMRAVITETQSFSVVRTRGSSLAFWMSTLNLARLGFQALHLEIAVISRRRLRTSRLGTAVVPGRRLRASRLGYYSAARTRASTLASWYYTVEARASCSASWHYTSGYD